jgi:Na+-transporting methylmalonyl-CoA/oxaloacetate decarboxylase gamma subunit
METESKTMSTKELTEAVSLLLEREETRVAQQRRKTRRRVHRRREEMRTSINNLAQSIEVIKWCIVGIATVMAIALVILVLVVWEIGNEAERIKGEVQQIRGKAETMVHQIEHEADMIRDKIQHPLRSIGGALGGQLDEKIGTALGLEDKQ